MTRRLLLLAAVLGLASLADAQTTSPYIYPFSTPTVSSAVSSTVTDGDIGLICQYVGLTGDGFVSVDAAGQLIFESPDASTADTSIECPVSLPNGGIFNPANAACNTVTKILNLINTPTSNFRCVPVNLLGTDDISSGGSGWLKLVTDCGASKPAGCALKAESSVALSLGAIVAPTSYNSGAKYFSGSSANNAKMMQSNPYLNQTSYLSGISTQSAFATTSVFNVYSVKGEFVPYYSANTGSGNLPGFTYNETITTLWGPTTNGATGVQKIFGTCDTPATACSPEWGPFGILGRKDEKMLVRMTNTGASSAFTLNVNGVQFPYK